MKIAIDARMYQESGIGRYIRNLLNWLQKLDKKNEYYILLSKAEYNSLNFNVNFHKAFADFRWYGLSEQYQIPKLLSKIQPDLVHFPHFNIPIFYRGKFVVTIHDLIHQHFRMERSTTHGPLIYRFKQYGYKKVFHHAINKSLKILVPSNFVKRQLIKEWEVESKKIFVTHEAVDDKILAIENKMNRAKIIQVLEKFRIKSKYIFYVGNAHPHKNVEGLIKAFRIIKEKNPFLELVLAGFDHYFWQRLKNENQHEGIIYTGYISDEELVTFYKKAECLVMPSFEEGFGIPLLEAFATSSPVVSSKQGSLPEVAGDAAIYFDPYNVQDMAEKIAQVLDSEAIKKELIEKGKKRVKEFSWEKMTEQTLEVYENSISA